MTTTQNKDVVVPTAKSVYLLRDNAKSEPELLLTADGKPREFPTKKAAWKWVQSNIRSPKQRKQIFVVPTH